MRVTLWFLVCSFALSAFTGCQSAVGIGHALGAIQTSDIRQAQYLRDTLPSYLGLPEMEITVEAGSGVTHVTIRGRDKQTLISELHDLEVSNPKLNPIKLRVDPEDSYIWSKATLIQR